MTNNKETRSYPRKILRSQARVALPGMPPMKAQTIDISLGGICLVLNEPMRPGASCSVGFEAPHNGALVRVFADAKVIYSILRGTEGYRTGLQFTQLDAANNKLLAELMI